MGYGFSDEQGMASAFGLAVVLLLFVVGAALFEIAGHNHLAAREAQTMTRLLEASESAVQLEAAKLERDEAARRTLGTVQRQDLEGEIKAEGIRWRAFAAREREDAITLPENGKTPAKGTEEEAARYRISAVSWQAKGEDGAPLPEMDEAAGAKCSHSIACYRYEKGRLVFEHWLR